MKMINLEELMDDIHTDVMCEVLTTIDALYEASKEALFDMLVEEGATMTELVMARYIMHRYVDVLRNLTDDAFEIGELCIGDCENCPCNEEE